MILSKKMKLMIPVLAVLLTMSLVAFTGCGDASGEKSGTTGNTGNEAASSQSGDSGDSESDDISSLYQTEPIREFAEDELLSGKHHVEIEVENYGVIKAELDADQAPITVTNFVKHAQDGFYDNSSFHRILTGAAALIQGGSPTHDGTGSSGERIKGEFTANGVNNTISHVRGTISLARTQDYDGGDCQFFIMASDYTGFDGQYAGFGTVTEGMEIVDAICQDTPVQDGNGTVALADQPVITTIRVVD